jgi:hypothetical protein
MPLNNDKDKFWRGWLADGLGGREQECILAIGRAIEARQIPKTKISSGTVNMWWRQSLYLDVTCELDGKTTTTIHVQPFGDALWVGRAGESKWFSDNYYKRMASIAFLEVVDRSIADVLQSLSAGQRVVEVREPAAALAA